MTLHRESIAGLRLVLGERERGRWPGGVCERPENRPTGEDQRNEGAGGGGALGAAADLGDGLRVEAARSAAGEIVLEAAGESCALTPAQVPTPMHSSQNLPICRGFLGLFSDTFNGAGGQPLGGAG